MSREFKFRVWDSSINEYLQADQDNPYLYCKLGISYNLSDIMFFYARSKNNRWVVQQYTGLTDKYDNPIYEGDIVKWDNLNYLVEWNDIAYKWQGRCPYYHSYHHPTTEHFRDLMNGIIAGNYIENPELLK